MQKHQRLYKSERKRSQTFWTPITFLCACALLLILPSRAILSAPLEVNTLPALREVSTDTVSIFDIDHVLLSAPSMDEWAQRRREIFKTLTPESPDAAPAAWQHAADLVDQLPEGTQFTLIEPSSPEKIKRIQEKRIVLGLTARGIHLNRWTDAQLKAAGINISGVPQLAPGVEHWFGPNLLYYNGVIYVHSERVNKGEALVKFLDHFKIRLNSFTYVDDKREKASEVETALLARNYRITSYWYLKGHQYRQNQKANHRSTL